MTHGLPDHGKPMILLLPGMDGTGALFKTFVRQLSGKSDVKIVSYPEDVYLSYEQSAEHVRNFVPLDRPYVLIAESYSGPVASLLAASPIGNLQGVFFVSSFVSFPLGRIGPWIAKLLPTFLFRLRPPAWLLRWFLMDAATPDEMISEVQDAIARVHPEVLAKRLRAALNADFVQALGKSTVRAVCLAPESDRLLGTRGCQGLMTARQDMKIEKIAGPHFLLQCAAEASCAALEKLGLLETPA